MFKKAVQQGRSERRGESYFGPYVEPLRFTPRRIRRGMFVNAAEMVRRQCLARTPLADFFNVLLEGGGGLRDKRPRRRYGQPP